MQGIINHRCPPRFFTFWQSSPCRRNRCVCLWRDVLQKKARRELGEHLKGIPRTRRETRNRTTRHTIAAQVQQSRTNATRTGEATLQQKPKQGRQQDDKDGLIPGAKPSAVPHCSGSFQPFASPCRIPPAVQNGTNPHHLRLNSVVNGERKAL